MGYFSEIDSILGYYNFNNTINVISGANTEIKIRYYEYHELLHKDLCKCSVFGLFQILLVSLSKNTGNNQLKYIFSKRLEESIRMSKMVHEGAANYLTMYRIYWEDYDEYLKHRNVLPEEYEQYVKFFEQSFIPLRGELINDWDVIQTAVMSTSILSMDIPFLESIEPTELLDLNTPLNEILGEEFPDNRLKTLCESLPIDFLLKLTKSISVKYKKPHFDKSEFHDYWKGLMLFDELVTTGLTNKLRNHFQEKLCFVSDREKWANSISLWANELIEFCEKNYGDKFTINFQKSFFYNDVIEPDREDEDIQFVLIDDQKIEIKTIEITLEEAILYDNFVSTTQSSLLKFIHGPYSNDRKPLDNLGLFSFTYNHDIINSNSYSFAFSGSQAHEIMKRLDGLWVISNSAFYAKGAFQK